MLIPNLRSKYYKITKVFCIPPPILYYCLISVMSDSCNPTDCSPPGSSVHGISQARILESVIISFSRGSSCPRGLTHISFIDRWVLYHWATREAPYIMLPFLNLEGTTILQLKCTKLIELVNSVITDVWFI